MFKGNKLKLASNIVCAILLVVAVLVSVYMLSNYKVINVSGVSMEDTYTSGQMLLCKKEKVKNIKYKDVIVFSKEKSGNALYIKRVIAVGNEKVKIKDNRIYINGEKLEEGYIKEDMRTPDMEEQTVPYKQLFVLGDNRNMSDDSRGEMIGFVSEDELLGKIVLNISDYRMDKVVIIAILLSLIVVLILISYTIKDNSEE